MTDASTATESEHPETRSDPLVVQILGTIFSLHVAGPELRDRLGDEWSRCVAAPKDGDVVTDLTINEGPTIDVTAYSVASRLTGLGIRGRRGRSIMLHAAGLADHAGRVLALVAPSGRGKTTAAVSLATRGLGYVTDETVAIDPDGSVVPYPKPVAFVDEASPTGPKMQHSPDALGMGVAPPNLRLSRLLLINRQPGLSGAPRIERRQLVDGLLDVIRQTSSLARLSRPLQTLCAIVDSCDGIHELTYAEIDETVPLLTDFLSAERLDEDTPEWAAVLDEGVDPDDMRWALLDRRIRRRPLTDAIQSGDEVLLMVADTPIRLSGIGLTIWEACRAAATPEEVLAAVVDVHGEHAEADRLTRQALDELSAAGVLAWGAPCSLADILAGRLGSMTS
ncbi:MAG TPA: hypothetical protein VFJ22_06830 [Dermatophilaceae bacterium]|jgi:hypothetical protein|nr:hypothetical protein [Dermatophilaceae bacterium]